MLGPQCVHDRNTVNSIVHVGSKIMGIKHRDIDFCDQYLNIY